MKFSRSNFISSFLGAISLCCFLIYSSIWYEEYIASQSELDICLYRPNFMGLDFVTTILILGFLCAIAAIYFLLNGITESRQNYKIVP